MDGAIVMCGVVMEQQASSPSAPIINKYTIRNNNAR